MIGTVQSEIKASFHDFVNDMMIPIKNCPTFWNCDPLIWPNAFSTSWASSLNTVKMPPIGFTSKKVTSLLIIFVKRSRFRRVDNFEPTLIQKNESRTLQIIQATATAII
ncbi:hypothetical protein TRFO_17161 [Tritrichomonas foetus]|uniref:Uncharacterized protein n=1 Tax=Tritrichomonas foetus TaxID=1144522 RepID=A0A1J4KTA5_9EUKA|nr:hypothetical protein TRFO_17161 [Tritrichomonas foetus]|eukprot:OHT12886.1 hypothetical protein TRFO_17161 [Tritrichomonas foetus]